MLILKCLLCIPQPQGSWEIYPSDTLLHHHNQSSSQHMAEDITTVLLQAWHKKIFTRIIFIVIRAIIYTNSSGHYMKYLAQNVLVNWFLLLLPLEVQIGEHKCCVHIWSFHSTPGKQIIFVNWPSSTHLRSRGWQTWLFYAYLDISFNS